nr:hypothetical protein BaRGS_008698 [Batillaria attramentaria]
MSKGGSAFPVFFMALAVSDLAILYVTLLRKWLGKGFGVRLSDTHDVPCKLYHWVGYSVGMLSAWFLAALAVQRAMTVAWPHGMRASCTRTQSFITIAVLVAVAFSLNAYTLFTTAVREDGRCGFSKDFQVSYQPVLGWFEMILYSLLPATVIVLSNCLLIYKFVQSKKRLESQSSRICRSGSTKVSRVTLTLIVVSLAFLVCTLPLGMMQDPSQTSPDLFRSESFVFWLSFASFLWYTNSAINFYIYLLTGSQFREELKKMLGIRERNPSGKARKEDF